jgi:hypothetical protein
VSRLICRAHNQIRPPAIHSAANSRPTIHAPFRCRFLARVPTSSQSECLGDKRERGKSLETRPEPANKLNGRADSQLVPATPAQTNQTPVQAPRLVDSGLFITKHGRPAATALFHLSIVPAASPARSKACTYSTLSTALHILQVQVQAACSSPDFPSVAPRTPAHNRNCAEARPLSAENGRETQPDPLHFVIFFSFNFCQSFP